MQILYIIFQSLIFPGLLFIFFIALATQWIVRKIVARMQNRMGPAYTGPYGFLQPFADFFKLMGKEDIDVVGSAGAAVATLLLLALGALVALILMIPASPWGLYAPGDVIIALYLLLWPTIALVVAGFAVPNAFSATGSSRFLSLVFAYEPPFIMALLVPVILATRYVGAEYSLYIAALNSATLWTRPGSAIAMALALFAAILALQAKLMKKPFDIPEAEQEIIAGIFTEYSGPKLALIILLHDIELAVLSLVTVYLFLGGPAPLTGPLGIISVAIKYFIIVLIVSWIRASAARLRVDQAIAILWKYVLPAAIISLIISFFV